MKNYKNGYQDKINYWTIELNKNVEKGYHAGILNAMNRLNYFSSLQVELIAEIKGVEKHTLPNGEVVYGI
jgi:hypothetical protein